MCISRLVEFELQLELKIEQKKGTSLVKLVLSRENPRHRQCADRTSVRPSYIFRYQHIELVGTAHSSCLRYVAVIVSAVVHCRSYVVSDHSMTCPCSSLHCSFMYYNLASWGCKWLVPADSVAISKIYNWDGQTLYCFEACRVLSTRAIT
jgi:hypothetical protein